jgi:hypothetical protein
VLHPAATDFPDTVRDFLLVNRSYLPAEKRKKSGIIYKAPDYYKEIKYLDSIASDNSLYAFDEKTKETNRFRTVWMDSLIKIKTEATTFLKPLPDPQKETLCAAAHADGIISLEAFQSFDSLYYFPYGYNVIGERATILTTMWRTYLSGFSGPFHEFTKTDTLYFSAEAVSKSHALKQLPSRMEALYEAAYLAGETYHNTLNPHWETIERIYFSYYDEQMRNAAELAKNENWRQAITIWKSIAAKEKGGKAAFARYNMAIASELEGNLSLARYWLSEALKIRPDNYYFLKYHEALKKRIKNQKLIDKQMKTTF